MALNLVGALFWAVLGGGLFRRFVDTGNLLALVLCFQASLAAWLILTRRRAQREARWPQRVVAWIHALLPQAVSLSPGSEPWWALAMGFVGVGLSVWALIHLGKSFGVAPADRGLVRHGPYRWLRHPMYAGEMLSLAAVAAAYPTLPNGALFGLSLLLVWWRIRWEERLLEGYDDYAAQVRFRLLPGVW